MNTTKLIRSKTVSQSLRGLLRGQLRFMSEYGCNLIGVSGTWDSLEEIKVNERVKVKAIFITQTISIYQDLKDLYKLYIFLKKEGPQIAHTHTPKARTLGKLATKLAGVTHKLHTIPGLPLFEAGGFKRKLLITIEKITYYCTTKIYPNSFGFQEIILENKYIKPNKLKVFANGSSIGIGTKHFEPAKYFKVDQNILIDNLGIKSRDCVFIFVRRLLAAKGNNELVASFSSLCKIKKNVKFFLLGPIENLDRLLPSTIKELGLSKYFSPGSPKKCTAIFCHFGLLGFFQLSRRFSNVAMQAGAMGLLSILTNINGGCEIFNHKENKPVIPVKKTYALEKCKANIMSKDNLFNQIKFKSREMIIDRFEQNLVFDAILASI